jgi:hypothetical protein
MVAGVPTYHSGTYGMHALQESVRQMSSAALAQISAPRSRFARRRRHVRRLHHDHYIERVVEEMMPALVTAEKVEQVIRDNLRSEGYEISTVRLYGQNGTDIIAIKGDKCLHIEAIAFKKSPSGRAKDFYECFFRAVSRLQNNATHCVLALPSRFGLGLPQRARAMGPAWLRIAHAFPELEIWLVNTDEHYTKRTTWGNWAS